MAKTPFDADQRRTNADAMVNERLLVLIISSTYVLKNELTNSGANCFAALANESVAAPICCKSESNNIIKGIKERNIKKAVCAEYALILLAAAFLVRYLILLIILFTYKHSFL